VQDLSVGERQRVEIIKCLMREPRLLVLDEPTAVLLPQEIDGLLAVCTRVAEEGCSVVLVTHKLAEVRRAAHRVTVLRAGTAVSRSDRPAQDIDELVRAMIQRELTSVSQAGAGISLDDRREQAKLDPVPQTQRGDVALQVGSLSFKDGQGVLRLNDIHLTVQRGEIVGVAGVEGNGQSELGAILGGMAAPTSGRFAAAGHDLTGQQPREITAAGVGVVPEDRHLVGCILGMSVAENLYLNRLQPFCRFGMLDRTALRADARKRMGLFDVRGAGPDAPLSSLSGGNQQKVVLARELGLPNLGLLVAAQPTRGLDVGAVEAIYQHIRKAADAGAGVLLISSELDELLSVADRIVVMYRGRIIGECPAQVSQRARIGAMMAGHEA